MWSVLTHASSSKPSPHVTASANMDLHNVVQAAVSCTSGTCCKTREKNRHFRTGAHSVEESAVHTVCRTSTKVIQAHPHSILIKVEGGQSLYREIG